MKMKRDETNQNGLTNEDSVISIVYMKTEKLMNK